MKRITALLISLCFVFFAGCKNEDRTVAESSKSTVSENLSHDAPYIIPVTIDKLRLIKNALSTMNNDEYKIYMNENHYGPFMNGMNNLENSKIFMEEFETTTIPVLDGIEENIAKLALYREDNCIHHLIIYDSEEIQRTSVWTYTAKSTRPRVMNFGDEVEVVTVKTIETDRYTANLYETINADYKFFGEITVDNSYIILRSFDIETMEEFEECFSRLEFRKIGDMLNEMPEETSEEVSSENEQTSVTENVSVAETALSEQAENIEIETLLTEFADISEESTVENVSE